MPQSAAHHRAKRKYYSSKQGKRKKTEELRRLHWRAKVACLEHYGGDPPKCVCCGETEIGFLTLDRVHKGSKSAGHRPLRAQFFHWLKRNGFPRRPALQVMCWNCNFGRNINGMVCPHKQPMTYESWGRTPIRAPKA